MWQPRDDTSVDYDPDWYAKYEAEQKRHHRNQVLKLTGYGYLIGQAIGTSAYVLQTRRANVQALSAGAFFGVCFGLGTFLRSGGSL